MIANAAIAKARKKPGMRALSLSLALLALAGCRKRMEPVPAATVAIVIDRDAATNDFTVKVNGRVCGAGQSLPQALTACREWLKR
jgi:uncharacterized lipoprotein YajG